jgi:hypothetical protein
MSLPTSRGFVTQLFSSLPAFSRFSADDVTTNIGASNPLSSAPDATKKQLLALHILYPNDFLPALDLLDRRLVTRFRVREDLGDEGGEPVPQIGETVNSASTTEITVRGHAIEDKVMTPLVDEHVNMKQRGEPSAHDIAISRAIGPMKTTDAEMPNAELHIPIPEELPNVHQIPDQEAHTIPRKVTATKEKERQENDTVYYVRSAQQRSSRFNTSYDSITSYEVRSSAWNCSCPAFAFAAFPSRVTSSTVPPSPSFSDFNPQDEVLMATGKGEDIAWSFGGISLGSTTPVCKHLLACVLVERMGMFGTYVEERDISWQEAAGWAAGWGD